jgi:hypothetical protein
MGRFVRREFLGSRVVFFLLCISGIGIPFAILYFIECLVTIEEELEEPGRFLEEWKAGKHRLVE